MTSLSLHLTIAGVILLGLGALHLVIPRVLGWRSELAGVSSLNREVSYVHCGFVGLACVLWGLLALTAGDALAVRQPVTRLVLVGAVVFWASRGVIQVVVFNGHGRESASWRALSIAATGLWLYVTAVWAAALSTQL